MTFAALTAQAQPAPLPTAEAVHRGELLFSGRTRFAHGGPSCIACHSVGGLAFPNGGTLGPDLTQATSRMGIEGIQSALKTLYFPAMVPLYKTQPLTVEEQQDLAAFLRDAAATTPIATTGQVAAIAGSVFLLLVLITWRAGRDRLGGVRRRLVATARAAAAAPRPIEGEPR